MCLKNTQNNKHTKLLMEFSPSEIDSDGDDNSEFCCHSWEKVGFRFVADINAIKISTWSAILFRWINKFYDVLNK